MAFEVVWSPEALEDVEGIAGYISRDSLFYAGSVVQRFLDAARSLADFPSAGRVVPELERSSIREVFVYSYRLIYRIQAERVTIAAVIHGRRLLESEDIASRVTEE